jgi:hypothetical protein
MNTFLEQPGDNLVNYHILPLLGMNKASFGEQNFINAYLSKKKDYIIVELKEIDEKLITALEKHVNYATDIVDDNRTLVLFTIPDQFKQDVDKFTEGKYSEFSPEAKAIVRKYSGLKYKVRVKADKGDAVITHAFLRALDKDADMRKEMEKFLGVKIAEELELLESPNEQNYYNLD